MNTITTKKLWIAFGIFALFVCSLLTILIKQKNVPPFAGTAYIYQDGELIRTIDLQQTSPLTFTIWGENDAFNIIEVTDGSIAVTNASCPDLICVHQGAINSDLIPITCLPNHLVISVSHTTDSDITAY